VIEIRISSAMHASVELNQYSYIIIDGIQKTDGTRPIKEKFN